MSKGTTRAIAGLAVIIGGTLVTGSGIAIHENTARAAAGNPWNFTMTDRTKDGMTINGISGSVSQIFTVKDSNGAPIFSVGNVGGTGVYSDHFRIYPAGDVFNPSVDIGPDGRVSLLGTNAGIWVNGQLLTSSDIAWIHEHE